MAKAGVITEVISPEAQKQVDALVKSLDMAVELAGKVNQAGAGIKGAGNLQQQNAAQKQANTLAQQAIPLTAKLTDQEIAIAKAKAEKAYRTKLANDAAKAEINANEQLVGAYKKLDTELSKLKNQYRDLAAAGKGNTEEAKRLLSATQALDRQIKEIDKSIGNHQRNVGNYTSALDRLKGGWVAVTAGVTAGIAAFSGVISVFKQAIAGAMEDERAMNRLKFAVDGNTAAVDRFARFKDKLMKTTLFSEAEIMAAINMGIELGRTEAETRKLVETAMGLARVTGTDLNTQMLALSGTYEGQTGRLGKLSSEIKDLTEEQLRNGEGVDILNKKYVQFATEGIGSVEGKVLQAKKWWGEFLDTVGTKFIEKIAVEVGKIQVAWEIVQRVLMPSASKYERTITPMRERIKEVQDETAAMIESARKKDEAQRKQREEIDKTTVSLKEQNDEWEQYVKQMKDLTEWEKGEFAGPRATRAQMGTAGTIERAPTLGAQFGVVTPGTVTTENEGIGTGIDAEQLRREQIAAEARIWSDRLSVAQEYAGRINDLVNSVYANRFRQMDIETQKDEEEKQRQIELADGNARKIDEINTFYDKKAKDRDKERRKLEVEQAKYNKIAGILQSIINTALAVSGSLAQVVTLGPAAFVLAALAGSIGAAQTALIAAQPIPAYAEGRKGGKAEFARINERGQEMVVTSTGDAYLPSGNFAYLPEGSSVIPHHDLVEMAGKASTYPLPRYTSTDTGIRQEINGLHAGFRMLASEIRNKKEAHINIDRHGFSVMQKTGENYVTWVNNRVRL